MLAMKDMQHVSYSGPLWHVVYTDTRAEKRAELAIKEAGYQPYCPVERLRAKYGSEPRERALFSRYVFVPVDPYRQDWQNLYDIDGVSDVLCNNGHPSHVPSSWIEALKKADACGIFDRTGSKALFEIGEIIRVAEGPFAGFNGVIEEFIMKLKSATATKRAKVLIGFMGRLSSVEVPLMSLEKT